VLPVDIPQIPLAFLDELIKIHEQGTIDMEIPLLVEREGFLEPLIGIYPVTMKNFIEERIAAGNFSVFRMIKEWGYVGVQTEIPEWQIANINTKEDYKRLLK
jgi:molybdopterin-guanine dinucleotide biosynthesis protein A